MSVAGAPTAPASRLSRLLGFLEQDPTNLQLIAEAAAAAVDEGAPAQAADLLSRYAQLAPLPPALMNLSGLIAIDTQRYADGAAIFEALLAANPEDPSLRFNLAWCRALLQDYEGAAGLLDERTAAVAPLAPALQVQMLHHLGRLDDALAAGQGLAERFPDNQDLMGALATVAMDAEDLRLASSYAARAGQQHDGLAALGMLSLNEDKVDQSLAYFGQALESYPSDARALLGRGLGYMANGDPGAAAPDIDRAAELFGHHLGSWVAAGWAYFVKGDLATSRARFETALALDDTFAETHGGLAVLDFMQGDLESAERRTEVALRLDRNCFAAALAKVLLLNAKGDAASAERVRNIALNVRIGTSGRTIAQAMTTIGLSARRPRG
ncbi:MAG TPA: tetratricopeptide repeat protein [Caulobacteraceae bacterium]|jgi:tetratricopeptide (TPR) repeat protein